MIENEIISIKSILENKIKFDEGYHAQICIKKNNETISRWDFL